MPEWAERGTVLIDIARGAIGEHLGLVRAREHGEFWLALRAASFVTLHLGEDLRGCIGSIDPRRPLGEDVASNALAAAFSDSRFPPLTAGEYPSVCVEVSVLSPRTPLLAASEAEAAARLRPGVDGVYLEFQGQSATFLPQVWQTLPDPVEFLEALRHKARLPARFWDPAIRITRYTVEKYGDGRAAH